MAPSASQHVFHPHESWHQQLMTTASAARVSRKLNPFFHQTGRLASCFVHGLLTMPLDVWAPNPLSHAMAMVNQT
eukprot:5617051-Amphidinium_carterae.3